jgi:hypothetical protein
VKEEFCSACRFPKNTSLSYWMCIMTVMLGRQKYSWTISTWSQSSWGWNWSCKAENYKSPGSDSVAAELIKKGGETLLSEIHKFIDSLCNKEELPD